MGRLADQRRCAVAHGLRLVGAAAFTAALWLAGAAPAAAAEVARQGVQAVPTDATAYPAGVVRQPALASQCMPCHGPNGNSQNPDWPKLAGQRQPYLLQQLQDFKSGQRRNPMMDAVVVNLQAADLKTLAAHFHAQTRSQLPPPAARPPGAAVHPAVASCTACHDNAALPGTPDLVGQQQPYLAQQLRAYRAGTRKNAIMEPLAKGLSDADITALAAYYSTLAPAAPARSR